MRVRGRRRKFSFIETASAIAKNFRNGEMKLLRSSGFRRFARIQFRGELRYQRFRCIDRTLDVTMASEMSGDVNPRNVGFKSFFVVYGGLAVLAAGSGFNSETFQYRQVRVGTDQYKDDVVRENIEGAILVFQNYFVLCDLDLPFRENTIETVLLQLVLERLLYPVLDTTLLRIVVLPIAAKDRERRIGSFFGKKQRGLTRRVPTTDYQRTFLHPRICFAEMIVDFRKIFAWNVETAGIIHRADREEYVFRSDTLPCR